MRAPMMMTASSPQLVSTRVRADLTPLASVSTADLTTHSLELLAGKHPLVQSVRTSDFYEHIRSTSLARRQALLHHFRTFMMLYKY